MKALSLSVACAVALTTFGGIADVSAQTMLQIRVLPAKPKSGEEAQLVGRFAPSTAAPSCNVKVDFGDDTQHQDVHIKEATELPLSLSHVYAKGGDYVVSVRPTRNGAVPACGGGNHSTLIEVLEP